MQTQTMQKLEQMMAIARGMHHDHQLELATKDAEIAALKARVAQLEAEAAFARLASPALKPPALKAAAPPASKAAGDKAELSDSEARAGCLTRPNV